MLERLPQDKFDRYHRMCGEGISHAGLKEAGCLDRRFIVNNISRAVEHWPGDIVIETRLNGYIIDRTLVLKELRKRFEEEGGNVSKETVGSIRKEGRGFILGTTSGKELRCTVPGRGRWSPIAGPEGTVPGSEDHQDMGRPGSVWIEDRTKAAIHFHYDQRYDGGYRWEFPNGSMSRIGFPRGTDEIPEDAVEVHQRAIPIGTRGEDRGWQRLHRWGRRGHGQSGLVRGDQDRVGHRAAWLQMPSPRRI